MPVFDVILRAVLVIACLVPSQSVIAADDELLATANQEHLWFACQPPKGQGDQKGDQKDNAASQRDSTGMDLYHHAADLGGPYYKAQTWLAVPPMAMASWGNRVWVVFPAKGNGQAAQMEVDTIQVVHNAALGIYLSDPSGRMEMVAGLPGQGRLASFVGTSNGPAALILPDANVQQSETAAKPQLLLLSNGRWNDIELPADFRWDEGSRVAAAGDDGLDFILLSADPNTGSRTIRFDRNAAGQWSRSELDLDLGRVRALVNTDGQITVVSASETGPDAIDIEYLRNSSTVLLKTMARPKHPWSITGMAGGLQLLERDDKGAITMRSIEPIRGEELASVRMEVQPLTAGKLWQIAILIAFSISGLLLVFLIKPVSKAPVLLPAGTEPLPVMLRVAALLIDLLPAGVLVGVLMRKPLAELLTLPVLSIDLERSLPYVLMAVLAVVHSAISELARGTSLGKALVGARVVTTEGLRPNFGQTLLRSVLKCLILLVPPLAIFALINPHFQGLQDMAAGTVVVHSPEQPQQREDQES